jgi:hypothetical protein
MPTVSIHDIAVSDDGKFVLTIVDADGSLKVKGIARLLDLVERKQICEFPVRHECPGLGTRLALGRDGKSCFVGCYDAYGIACYSLPEGKEIWRRKDLKSVQRVTALNHQGWVFCGRQTGAAHLLEASTGETFEKLTGVKDCYGSPVDETVVVVGRSLKLQRPFGKTLTTVTQADRFSGYGYFTAAEVVFYEHELIRCYDIGSLELLWSHKPTIKIRFANRFVLNKKLGCFQMLQLRNDGPHIVQLDRRSGAVMKEIKLETGASGNFCLNGQALFDGQLCLFSSENGLLLHDFTTEDILSKDHKHKQKMLLSFIENSKSPVELEKYMKAEGFSEPEIKKAVFIKMYNDELAKRRKEKE